MCLDILVHISIVCGKSCSLSNIHFVNFKNPLYDIIENNDKNINFFPPQYIIKPDSFVLVLYLLLSLLPFNFFSMYIF